MSTEALIQNENLGKGKKEENMDKLPLGRFFAWKTRNISLAGSFLILSYLSIYCTDTLGMPATLVGTLLLASKVFDGLTDLFAGYLVDNTKTKLGKGRPYELAIIGVWLFTLIMYSIPEEATLVIKSLWVFSTYMLVNSIFATLLNAAEVPYQIRAFGSRRRLIKVASYGGIVSVLGASVISISFPIMMSRLATSHEGWRQLILIYSIPLLLLGVLRFIFVKEHYDGIDGKKEEKLHFKDAVKMLKVNPYVWYIGAIALMANAFTGMHAATYYFSWVVGDIARYSSLQALTVPLLLSMFIVPKIMKKYPVGTILLGGSLLGLAGGILNFMAGDNIYILSLGFVGTSLAMMPPAYFIGVVVLDCAKFNQFKGLPRMEGTSSAVNNFAMKLGQGIGAGLLGILLGSVGYDGTLSSQPESAMTMIKLLYGLVPIILFGLSAIFSVLYSRIHKIMPEIERHISGATGL